MSKAETVADAITRIVKQNELLTYAAELLREYGSLENAVAKRTKQTEQVSAAYEQLKREHDEFDMAMETAKAEALAEINAAKQEAKDVVAKAKAKAKVLDEQAEANYAARLDEANTAAINQVSDYESKLRALREVIAEKETHINGLDSGIAGKTKELAELEKRVDGIRDSIAKLVLPA